MFFAYSHTDNSAYFALPGGIKNTEQYGGSMKKMYEPDPNSDIEIEFLENTEIDPRRYVDRKIMISFEDFMGRLAKASDWMLSFLINNRCTQLHCDLKDTQNFDPCMEIICGVKARTIKNLQFSFTFLHENRWAACLVSSKAGKRYYFFQFSADKFKYTPLPPLVSVDEDGALQKEFVLFERKDSLWPIPICSWDKFEPLGILNRLFLSRDTSPLKALVCGPEPYKTLAKQVVAALEEMDTQMRQNLSTQVVPF